MAELNPNIILAGRPADVEHPGNMLAKVLAIKNMQSEMAYRESQAAQQQQALQRQNMLREHLATGQATEESLRRLGFLEESLKMGKEGREQKKLDAETDVKKFELYKNKLDLTIQRLGAVQNPQQAQAWVSQQVQDGVVPMAKAQEMLSQIPQDPQGFMQWRDNTMRTGLTAQQHFTNLIEEGRSKETQRHNRSTEGAAYGQLQVSRDRLAFDQANPMGVPTDTANGLVLVDPRRGTSRPVVDASGRQLPPKQSESVKKEATDIQSQIDQVNGAREAIKATPDAFGVARGVASKTEITEAAANRMTTEDEKFARSKVFNIVSSVIKERAGTAQTPGETARLNKFLPGDLDDAATIEAKLKGFEDYLKEKQGAYLPRKAGGNAPPVGFEKGGYRFMGGDPAQQSSWKKI